MVTFHKRAQKIQNPVVLLKMWKDAVHFCHPSTVEITHWRSNLLCFFFSLQLETLRKLVINNYFIFILPVDTSWPEESYGGISTENRLRAARDRAALPTAPRAARGPDIDSTKIPDGPPFTAFLGNLSYDVDKDDILEFFGNNKVLQLCMI